MTDQGQTQRRRLGRVGALAAGGALLIGGAVGTMATVANAQTPTATPSPVRQATGTPSAGSAARTQALTDYINRLAGNLGVTPDRLRAALQQTALAEVDAALARGDLTAAQAQAARDRINTGNVHFGPGFGRGGPGGPGGRDGRGGFGVSQDALAQFLGITAAQLRTELSGTSLTQVAQAHNKTRAQLVQFMLTTAQQQIAAEVQAGRLTQQQATERLANLQTRIEQQVDEVRTAGQRSSPGTSPRTTATPTR